MKTPKLLITLTCINLVLVLFLLLQTRRVEAEKEIPVLKGRALEIIDEQGRVRASIKVQAPEPGKTFAETVILRLIDPKGRPEVKLAASEQGAGLALLGETDKTVAILKSEGAESLLKLTNEVGREKVVQP